MNLDLTFKKVCATIKEQGKEDPKLLAAVDHLLGLAFICSPGVIGPATAALLLPMLTVKNELIKIGKSVYDKFTKPKEEDYLLRHETMRTAYGLLVFTSFFDALDARLPDALRKEIAILPNERVFLAKDSLRKTVPSDVEALINDTHDSPAVTHVFPFPHPTETLSEQCQRQAKLWRQLGQGFIEFVQKLAFWDEADEKKKAILLYGLEKVDEEAAKRFEAQYFELARRFEDFAVWANLHAHRNTRALIGDLSDYVRQHADLTSTSGKAIDIGFARLRETVLSIPETLRIQPALEISESLNNHYKARIDEPIIEDKDFDEGDKPRLSFPKVSDAFVPQAFRVLRQSGKSRRLEDESTWSELPRRNDLGAFLLSYLSSPYSTEAPLLILGHPGSGKSLLTKVLSAQLMSKHFTAIRVPLREVNADADIVTQIEEAIRRITGVGIDSWIKLSALFHNCPPLVILDGYDELLQASGQVFASYVKDAQRFQEREAEQGRPLRIIITSRVTLIDKAAVPVGSTIIRLLEFDKDQRDCWSDIWNKANAGYWRDARTEKFVLPGENEKGAEKILNLAEQPLLLLMLALYDSEGNRLRSSKGLDRTKLYDSLLRRFVIRERGKEKGFNDTKAKEREKALLVEMQRLGVAALGMYNRRKVHILSPELDDDLAFFKLERSLSAKSGKALSQADLLLGSFFFIHKSKAQHTSGAEETHDETAAFEFLHNTFGEFLTADFILRRAVSQVQALRAAESNEALKSVLDKMMGTADGFERDWFASLVYTPLFTRPVIMEMIREWTPHVLREYGLREEDFLETLEKIVLNQIRRLLNQREMPQIMRKETAQEGYRVPFGDHPLVGHIAIYSINLVLLRLIAAKRPFNFDESQIASYEDGTRPWDRLTYIWRSWFSLGNLNGLTAVMLADRSDSEIAVTAKRKFQAEESKSKVHEFHNVAIALGDNVSAGITGIYLLDPSTCRMSDLDILGRRLNSEGFELVLPVAMAKLLTLAGHLPETLSEFVVQGKRTLEHALQLGRRDQLENVCLVIARALEENMHSVPPNQFRDLLHPRLVIDVAFREPRSAQTLFNLGKHFHDHEWLHEVSRRLFEVASQEMPRLFKSESGWSVRTSFLRLLREVLGAGALDRFRDPRRIRTEFLEHLFHPDHLVELSEHHPEGALAYLQILRELGGERYFQRVMERHIDSAFLERMFHPGHLLELSERHPEGALAYLQILREVGGGYLDRFAERVMKPEFLERMFHPRHLLELSARRPEGALAYLQILRELGSTRYYQRFVEHELDLEVFARMFHSGNLLELSERDPKGWLAYLQILQEVGGGRYFERLVEFNPDPEFFERMFHPRYLLELSERHPEGALAYLQVLRDLGGGRYFARFAERNMDPEFFERVFQPTDLLNFSERRIQSLAVWATLARLFQSSHVAQVVSGVISAGLRDRPGFKRCLSVLPIASLADLRWISEKTRNFELQSFVAELTGSSASAYPE